MSNIEREDIGKDISLVPNEEVMLDQILKSVMVEEYNINNNI